MSRGGFWVLALLWLPLGVMALSALRSALGLIAANDWVGSLSLQALAPLFIVAPAGLPLALACRLLWRRGRRSVAVGSWIVAGGLSIAAALYAGLSGPVAIVIATVVLSLPVCAMAVLLPPVAALAAPDAPGAKD